jgi:hypothetical protein
MPRPRGSVLKDLEKGDHIVFVRRTGPLGHERARLLVANLDGGVGGWTGPTVSGS